MGVAASRFSSLPPRIATSEPATTHRLLDINDRPSRPGMRKST